MQFCCAYNAESMKNGFQTEIFNQHGSSSRGPYEGGQRERDLADYYIKLSKKNEHTWPVAPGILNDLAQGYLFDVKRIDEEAARDALEY